MENKIEAKALPENLKIEYIEISSLRHHERNPRTWSAEATEQLRTSIEKYGVVDALIVNSAPERKGIIIGGNFRASVLREMGIKKVPVIYINIPDLEKEAELVIRLNKNTGEFDLELLASFDESLLSDIGFTTEELDEIFPTAENPEIFDLAAELAALDITKIDVKKGDVYEINDCRVMCGNSMEEADMLKLMGDERADMCFTDPPYLLDYLHGKKKHKSTEGFGYKRDRHYLGTETLPDDFTERWMSNVAKVQKPDFSIIIFENPKNLRIIWNELEKHWKYRNTITWHVPNRVQGFSAKNKFFNKTDIALVGTGGNVSLRLEPESDELLQNEYENALYAVSGKAYWEGYEKGRKYCPTDFISFKAADKASSGQGIIFGTKPVELLIPYIKVLTRRGDIVLEPFGGSGSTAAAAAMMHRRCFLMEKSEVYTTVILKRLEKLSKTKATKL